MRPHRGLVKPLVGVGWVLWLTGVAMRPADALEFPGLAPGLTEACLNGGALVLQNAVISAHWTIADGHLALGHVTNRMTNECVRGQPSGGFALTLSNGRTLRSTDLTIVGKPVLARINPQPRAVQASLRYGGWRAVVQMTSADSDVHVEWDAALRDGANAVRQRLNVSAPTGLIAIKRATLLSLRASRARTVGEVDGSPVVAGTLFIGCESPLALNTVEGDRVTCAVPVYGALRKGEVWTGTSAIGAVPAGQLRRGFLYYVERERPRPYRSFLHYNSWYDIAWKDRKMDQAQCLERIEAFAAHLFKQRGTALDGFVFDDGWDDNKTLWRFHEGFPQGFTPLAEAVKRCQSSLGVWMSPWGGYGPARAERLKYGQTQGFETNQRGFSLAGPRYCERFRDVCVEMMSKYGIRYFKFDGVGAGSSPTGAGAEFGPDIQALMRLLADLRHACPDVFLNVTAGTWPSPFWLWHSDAVWRGGRDAGHAGKGSMRQRWLTYRDMMVHQGTVVRAPLFPLNSLKSQGLCLGQLGRHYAKMAADPKDVIDEIRMMMASGTQLQDLFVTPTLMTPEMWDALAEAARWCRQNVDVLVDTHWIGGDPAKGQVYGYASWSPRKGIVVLRNPSDVPAVYKLDVQDAFELPPGAPRRYSLRSPWARASSGATLLVEAGRPHERTLAPFETLVLDALPTAGRPVNR